MGDDRVMVENQPTAKFQLFEDFYGTWAIGDAGPADRFSTTAGAGTGNAAAVTVAASLCGEVTIKSASDDGQRCEAPLIAVPRSRSSRCTPLPR